ncbi:hypothetical protein DYB37_003695 [Aphanomyces astaci]|uniref:BTB domain-containing protein n=1 Tax=Aphanomyces astaci TaxID=112090 RepID=A0A3R7AVI2_APHAT|nr:hypothetical protein DYB37_003695 [Aphanomyces astaci]
MAARILTSAHLTLEDFTALSTHLTTHRALLLWDERDDDRRNAWHVAAAHGHDSVLTLLHGLGDGLDARDRKKLTPLHAAAANGHPSTVRLLLSLGASPAAVDKHGNTPFHVACRYVYSVTMITEGHVAVVKVLLPKSKVDGRNRRRDTPLLLAVRSAASKPPPSSQSKASVEWMDVVRLLLVAGASPLVANHDGHTPLYESLLSPGLALAQKLLVYGYPTAANTSQSASPTTALLSVLYQAVCTGHVDAVELLVPYLPPSEWLVVDKVFGDSLLHAAVRHVRVTNALLRALIQSSQHGKALHAAENKALQTPLFLAIHLGNADAVARLLAHGGVPNERNRRLHSALYVAVRTHQIPCVRELIAAGCSLDADCIAFVKAHTPMALPPLVAAPSTWLPATTTSDMQTVVCTVDGQVDAVHIALLVGHCPSLRARLCGPWAAATSTSSLAIDATRSTWTLVKAYLYNGGCSNLLSNVEENGEELVELLVLANSLLLFDLQRLCLATLQQALTPRDFRELETHLGTLACRDSDCDDVAARVIDTWRHDRRQLLTNQWLANVALIAEGGGSQPSNVHTCHRAVVSAASPVLRAHFNSNHTEYSLPFTTKVVDFVLEFMYTETLAELAVSRLTCYEVFTTYYVVTISKQNVL